MTVSFKEDDYRAAESIPPDIKKQREQLPIAQGELASAPCVRPLITFVGKGAIVREIFANDVTIILGETGSGKTTRPSASLRVARASLTALCIRNPAISP
jgi:HrpA-like RNA helicase